MTEEELKQKIMMRILEERAVDGRKIRKWWRALHDSNPPSIFKQILCWHNFKYKVGRLKKHSSSEYQYGYQCWKCQKINWRKSLKI